MKVAIYCRVSTEEQNVEQQKDLLTKYCKDKGYFFRSYVDNGISGKIEDRPAWRQLINDCNNNEFNAILTTKSDRITRDLEYALKFYKWIIEKKIKLISLYDNIDLYSPDGYFTFMLKSLLSEYELLQMKWRSKIGIDRAKREGKYKGGKKGRKWAIIQN